MGYRHKSREKNRQRARLWHENNRERHLENNRRWVEENRERYKEIMRVAQSKRRARVKSQGTFDLSAKDRRRLEHSPCAHAHYGQCDGSMHVDHVIPISRGGSHGIGNLQSLCAYHNRSKSKRLEIEVKALRLTRLSQVS
jgi:5-methylcytosine-specific restriction endonuclease McrA